MAKYKLKRKPKVTEHRAKIRTLRKEPRHGPAATGTTLEYLFGPKYETAKLTTARKKPKKKKWVRGG